METFDTISIMKKVDAICCKSDVSNFIRKQQKDYAGHVVRMPIERCEKQLIFSDDKYHRTGRVTFYPLEQVLKFNNSTIDNFMNNSMTSLLENVTLTPVS